MENRADEKYTVTVTAENVRTGDAATTRYYFEENGEIEIAAARTGEGCESATEILRKLVEKQTRRETINARALRERDEPGVWYEVARKIAEETLCRDGDGNYHLITTERAGASKEGLRIVQKRSRELMDEEDARIWAAENMKEAEYYKAFPNE